MQRQRGHVDPTTLVVVLLALILIVLVFGVPVWR